MFRKVILNFLGVKDGAKETIEEQYCKVCRSAKQDDCANCSKEIGVMGDARQ